MKKMFIAIAILIGAGFVQAGDQVTPVVGNRQDRIIQELQDDMNRIANSNGTLVVSSITASTGTVDSIVSSGTITGSVVNAGTTISAGTTLKSGTTLTVGTSASIGTTLGVTGLATLNDLTVNTNATITGIATFNGSIKIGAQTGWTGIVTNHGNGITNLMWIGKGVVTNVTYIP